MYQLIPATGSKTNPISHKLNSFVLVLICVHIIITIITLIALIKLNCQPNFSLVVIFQILTIGFSFELSEILFGFSRYQCDLPRLNHLKKKPFVAILYLICDDVIPEAIEHLGNQNYKNYHVFILDDSTIPFPFRSQSDQFTILRRADNKGFKAGNLNNWLHRYYTAYDYFIILDSDSIIPPDFIKIT